MQCAPCTLESKDFVLVGKLYAQTNPDHALSLVEGYKASQAKALDTDLHNLNYYYLLFCNLNNLTPSSYLGSLHASDKIDKRRLFIGTMIRIYMPQFLTHELEQRTGFNEGLCIVLRQDSGNLSKTIDEVKEWMKKGLYGFMDTVQDTAEQLLGTKNQFTGSLFDKNAA